MNIADFLPKNIENGEVEREIKFDRINSPFILTTITEKENEMLRKASTSKRIAKGGNRVTDIDTDTYVDRLVVKCVKFPNLNDSELQEAYNAQGQPVDVLKNMLRAGEYAELTQAIQELNGFDRDTEELVEDVKK